jgi:hypothetical protein
MNRLHLIHQLPCVVCHILRLEQTTRTEAHHLKKLPDGTRLVRGNKRAHDDFTIPLCRVHHWNGVHNPTSLSEFERIAGRTEPELWAITNEMLSGLEEA